VAEYGVPAFGVDLEQVQSTSFADVVRRRFDGRSDVVEFGADPQLQDLVAPLVLRAVPVRVVGADHLPRRGPGLLVSNRGLGVLEPTALSVAVRREVGRRLRIVGAPELPVVGDLMRKFGSIGPYAADIAALLRAGHLAALPLAPSWLRTGAGIPPTTLLGAALGYPVCPVLVRPGGPFGLPLAPWRVVVGAPLSVGSVGERDPLSAAELVEQVRVAVDSLD
jgi:hypothetical protein